MIDEWDITATNLSRFSKREYEVAVLPTAAIEPHNRHLPMGQDFRHATWVARECCRRAWQREQSVLCLPGIPYGVDCNLMGFPGTIHVSQGTLDAMVREVVVSLRTHGIRKIVVLNGHGGNDFGPLIRQIQCDMDVFVFLCDWWKVGQDRYGEFFDKEDDHAGQMETSVAMAIYGDLVELESAGEGKARPFRYKALREGWVRTSRDFSKLNDHCAVGDASGASGERGKAYLELVCARIAGFLVELAQDPVDELFPYER